MTTETSIEAPANDAPAPDNPGRNQDGTFAKGVSGNPKGCPRSSRHRATIAAMELLDGEAHKLTRKAVELALDGDTVALRLCLERIVPAAKSRPIKLEMPPVDTMADVLKAQAVAIQAMADGEITPDEAATIAGVLEAKRRAIETVELEKRIAALEGKAEGQA
jgi:Family of unknown function (DUF5681)